MEKGQFKFKGYINNIYSFMDNNGSMIKFSKCRKELIDRFKLQGKESLDQWFEIYYFKTLPLNHMDNADGVLIISELDILKN